MVTYFLRQQGIDSYFWYIYLYSVIHGMSDLVSDDDVGGLHYYFFKYSFYAYIWLIILWHVC